MEYANTRVEQRVVVVHAEGYSDAYVGKTGEIKARFDGINEHHGTVEVQLDGEYYSPKRPGWMQFTHMGVDQLQSVR